MTALALLQPDQGRDLSALSADELKAALADCLRVTAGGLLSAAAIVLELEKRGEDLDSLRVSMMKYLRLIAHGQASAEAVVRFAGKPMLLNAILTLPLPDQERLATGEPVRLLTYTPDGKTTYRLADPRDMVPAQIRQAFDQGKVRSDAEQALWLDEQIKRAKRSVPSAVGDLKIDRERGGAYVGRKFIPLADLAAAVAALRK